MTADGAVPGAGARPLVVKLGGTSIAEEQGVLREIALVAGGRPVVVVHGGGRRLSDWLDRLGVEHRWQEGLRVTDDAALEVALAILGGLVNGELVAELGRAGARAVGVSGIDGALLAGDRVPGAGRVVSASRVRRELLDALLAAGMVPVVAPLALDPHQQPCNVNADDAAAAVAGALGAELVLLTDTDGVRDASGRRLAELSGGEAERLIAEGVVSAGMVPKVRSATRAVENGAWRTVIADGRREGALAASLAGSLAAGTRVVR